MDTTQSNPSVKQEEDVSEDPPELQKFICTLCTFKFSKERYLTNHYKFCKDVKNANDRLGVNATHVKKESREEDEQSMEAPGNIKAEPMNDKNINLELKSIESSATETLVKPGNQFKCTICGYSTSKLRNLKVHIKTHKNAGVKAFNCTICDYSTAESGSLKIHMRKHTGEKPFKCMICDFSTALLGNLKVHMRKHTGEKPFKCTICDYSTADSGNLKVHMRKHTGEKPFKCTICDHSTVVSGNLKIHMRKHTGEKPFKCTICEYSAAQSGQLKIHTRTHTERKTIKSNDL